MMNREKMPKRYCGFKMIAEDGTPVPAPWKKSTGFTVKEEVSEAVIDKTGPLPIKKVKLVNRVLSSMKNSHHQMDVDDINR